ncbi:MAG: EamA family transporter RarD [Pseudomonadota bacterium]
MNRSHRPFPGPSGSAAGAQFAPSAAVKAAGANALQSNHAEARRGLIAAIGAYIAWGLLPAFIKLLDGVSPYEVLIHRVLWAAPFCGLIITVRRQWGETKRVLRDFKTLRLLCLSGLFIGTNWLIFIFAVANDRILETSIGYYINPLMMIMAGVILLGERITQLQIVALLSAASGVLVLMIGNNVVPWTALQLAVTFTVYALLRKQISVGAVPGLFIETMVLTPFALTGLFFLTQDHSTSFINDGPAISLYLSLAGPFTVIPLTLFAVAARRISLTTIGFLQYIGPTMAMIFAVLIGEPFTVAHAICFSLIWIAVALVSFEALHKQRQARQRLASSSILPDEPEKS